MGRQAGNAGRGKASGGPVANDYSTGGSNAAFIEEPPSGRCTTGGAENWYRGVGPTHTPLRRQILNPAASTDSGHPGTGRALSPNTRGRQTRAVQPHAPGPEQSHRRHDTMSSPSPTSDYTPASRADRPGTAGRARASRLLVLEPQEGAAPRSPTRCFLPCGARESAICWCSTTPASSMPVCTASRERRGQVEVLIERPIGPHEGCSPGAGERRRRPLTAPGGRVRTEVLRPR